MKTFDSCPECGSKTTFGYGLMGGGMGAYQLCENDGCDWFIKDRECLFCDAVRPDGQVTCGSPECLAKEAARAG